MSAALTIVLAQRGASVHARELEPRESLLESHSHHKNHKNVYIQNIRFIRNMHQNHKTHKKHASAKIEAQNQKTLTCSLPVSVTAYTDMMFGSF